MKTFDYVEESIEFDMTSEEISIECIDPIESADEMTIQGTRDLILLHGWNSKAQDMNNIKGAIRHLKNGRNYRIWNVSYDTNITFKESADKIINMFNAKGLNSSNCVIVSYSMGGVVARSMISQGFYCRKLITICTPHEGLAPWVPTPTYGTASIAPWSDDLKKLNNNPTDKKNRGNYYFFGITYKDLRGQHLDDAVVEYKSAIGKHLSGIKYRGKNHLNYGNSLPGGDPHSRGMDPAYLSQVINLCNKIL